MTQIVLPKDLGGRLKELSSFAKPNEIFYVNSRVPLLHLTHFKTRRRHVKTLMGKYRAVWKLSKFDIILIASAPRSGAKFD